MNLKRHLAGISLLGASFLAPMQGSAQNESPSSFRESKITQNEQIPFDTLSSKLNLQRDLSPKQRKNLTALLEEIYKMPQGTEKINALILTQTHIGYQDRYGQYDLPAEAGGVLSTTTGSNGTQFDLILNPERSADEHLSTLNHELEHLMQEMRFHKKDIHRGKYNRAAYAMSTLMQEMDADVTSVESAYSARESHPDTWKQLQETMPYTTASWEQSMRSGLTTDEAYTRACKASIRDYDAVQKRIFGNSVVDAIQNGYRQSDGIKGEMTPKQVMEVISNARYQGDIGKDLSYLLPADNRQIFNKGLKRGMEI